MPKACYQFAAQKRNHLQQAMPWIFVPTPMLACRRPRASRHPQGKLSKLERSQMHHNVNRNEQTMLFGCSTREKFNTQAMPRIRYKVQNDSNVLPERLRCSTRSLSHLRPSTLTLRPSNAHVLLLDADTSKQFIIYRRDGKSNFAS